MSRLMEWMEREEHLLNSYKKECDSRIAKAEKEIEANKEERDRHVQDLAYLTWAKKIMAKMEMEEDPNGQLKLPLEG